MLGIRVNADTQGDIVLPIQLQIGKLDGGKLDIVQRASAFIHPPRLEQTVLRGGIAPPGGIEPPAPSAVIARAGPDAQLMPVHAHKDVALEIVAVHRRVGGNLHREFQRFQLARRDFAQRKTIFQLTGFEPEHLRVEAVGVVKGSRGIAFADPCVFGYDAAFRTNRLRGRVAADGQAEGQGADAILQFRNEAHADRVDPPGTELHCTADTGLDLGINQSGFLELAHIQRSRGNRHVQRVGDFIDVHRT